MTDRVLVEPISTRFSRADEFLDTAASSGASENAAEPGKPRRRAGRQRGPGVRTRDPGGEGRCRPGGPTLLTALRHRLEGA